MLKICPIKVSQALVKCSRGEKYNFKAVVRFPRAVGSLKKPSLGLGAGSGRGDHGLPKAEFYKCFSEFGTDLGRLQFPGYRGVRAYTFLEIIF